MEWKDVKTNPPFKDPKNHLMPVTVRLLSPATGSKGFFSGIPEYKSIGFAYFGYKVPEIPEDVYADRIVYKLRWGFLNFRLEFIQNVTHWMPLPEPLEESRDS